MDTDIVACLQCADTSKIVICKRTQFPFVKADYDSQNIVLYNNLRLHYKSRFVYVTLFSAISLNRLCLTNPNGDHVFYHRRSEGNRELINEFARLERHHLRTMGDTCRDFLDRPPWSGSTPFPLCTFNTHTIFKRSLAPYNYRFRASTL